MSKDQLPAKHKANQNCFPVGELNHAMDKRSGDQLSDRCAGRSRKEQGWTEKHGQVPSMIPFPRFSITS